MVQTEFRLETKGTVRIKKPTECFERDALVCQRRYKAITELSAIGAACALRELRLALYQGDFKSGFQQRPCGCQTDYATTNYDNMLHAYPVLHQEQ